jgi:hypothetical protein
METQKITTLPLRCHIISACTISNICMRHQQITFDHQEWPTKMPEAH